ncbi:MAG: metallophosphoesterase family protein, partial [Planctomycetota bacterium]
MERKICGQSRVYLLLAAVLVSSAASPLFAEFRFTVTGDPRDGLSRWQWTLSEMANKVGDEGAFHITAGDYYEDGAVTVAADFYDALKIQFGEDVVWYPTVGNHETDTTDMPWLRQFYYDHLQGTVSPGPVNCEETMYSWDYQNAHFVQLNMYYDGITDEHDDGEFRDELYNWLVNDLDTTTKSVVFVIYHEPAYPEGRGGKSSPAGWERFWKLLNDRKVYAGLCAHSHQYARYQVDGDWETFTWEVDAGNAGRLSHGDPDQTFVDVTVSDDGTVEFVTWRGMENEQFTVTDTWTVTMWIPDPPLPSPADGANDVPHNVVLTWTPGTSGALYDVYFGTDLNDVNDANDSWPVGISVYKGRQESDRYGPGLLELGRIYYWRVDQVKGSNVWKSGPWSFTVTDVEYYILDDMESYNATTNLIYDTWIDGFYNWTGSWLELGIDPC